MANELTPWFNEDQKPVRIGVYETQFYNRDRRGIKRRVDGFSYWNGREWGMQRGTASWAFNYGQNITNARQDKEWRGRTKP